MIKLHKSKIKDQNEKMLKVGADIEVQWGPNCIKLEVKDQLRGVIERN
jgi:hypothetical protein